MLEKWLHLTAVDVEYVLVIAMESVEEIDKKFVCVIF